jgi:hypothetical protein
MYEQCNRHTHRQQGQHHAVWVNDEPRISNRPWPRSPQGPAIAAHIHVPTVPVNGVAFSGRSDPLVSGRGGGHGPRTDYRSAANVQADSPAFRSEDLMIAKGRYDDIEDRARD